MSPLKWVLASGAVLLLAGAVNVYGQEELVTEGQAEAGAEAEPWPGNGTEPVQEARYLYSEYQVELPAWALAEDDPLLLDGTLYDLYSDGDLVRGFVRVEDWPLLQGRFPNASIVFESPEDLAAAGTAGQGEPVLVGGNRTSVCYFTSSKYAAERTNRGSGDSTPDDDVICSPTWPGTRGNCTPPPYDWGLRMSPGVVYGWVEFINFVLPGNDVCTSFTDLKVYAYLKDISWLPITDGPDIKVWKWSTSTWDSWNTGRPEQWYSTPSLATAFGTYIYSTSNRMLKFRIHSGEHDDTDLWKVKVYYCCEPPCVPHIALDPTSLSKTCTKGAACSGCSFQVWDSKNCGMPYTISDGNTTWMSEDPTSGSSSGVNDKDTINVNFSTSSLDCGTYEGDVTITACTADNSPQTVHVTLNIVDDPSIGLSTTSISNSCDEGEDATNKTFKVWNDNSPCGTLEYTISDNRSWLDCNPKTGTSTGEQDTITCTFNTDSLDCGGVDYEDYDATITISDPDADDSPRTISVSLRVVCPEEPCIEISPTSLDPSCLEGQNATTPNSFKVRRCGTGTLSYTVSESITWLSRDPPSGTSTGEWDTINLTYSTSSLSCGVSPYSGTIRISDPNAWNSPVDLPVTLTVTCVSDTYLEDPPKWSPTQIVRDNPGAVQVVARNDGSQAISNRPLKLKYGTVEIASTTVNILANESTTARLFFSTTDLPTGSVGLVAYLEPSADEGNTTNNSLPINLTILPENQAQTLVFTELTRMETILGMTATEREDLTFDLVRFTTNTNIVGVFLDLHNVSGIPAQYATWDGTSPPRQSQTQATNVAGHIDDHIEYLLTSQYTNVSYLVIIGTDEIVPFFRAGDDANATAPEANYSADVATVPDTIRFAYTSNDISASGCVLTDSYYADLQDSDDPVPDLAIGRLVETPAQVRTCLNDFIESGPNITVTDLAVVAGAWDGAHTQDATGDLGNALATLLQTEFPGVPLTDRIGLNWNATDLTTVLTSTTAYQYLAIHWHAAHWAFEAPGDANFVLATPGNYGGIVGGLVVSIGCHSGVPVRGDDDWPEVFSGGGAAALVGNTTYGIAHPSSADHWHEWLHQELSRRVCQHASIGRALSEGKARYRTGTQWWQDFHELWTSDANARADNRKVLMGPTLYGIPHYRYGVRGATAALPVRTPTVPSRAGKREALISSPERTLIRDELTIYPGPYTEHTDSKGGVYFLGATGETATTVGVPLFPATRRELGITGLRAHGALIDGESHTDRLVENPSYSTAVSAAGTVEREFTEEVWFPSLGLRVDSVIGAGESERAGEAVEALVSVTAQYHLPTHTLRLYDAISYDIFFSDSSDWTRPTITQVGHTPQDPGPGQPVTIGVAATDPSGIYGVAVRTSMDNANTWETGWATYNSGTGKWELVVSSQSYTYGVYYVSVVDNAGNVLTDKNGGAFYSLATGQPPVLTTCGAWTDGCDPDEGDRATTFNFCVHYVDPEGTDPATAQVVIDGHPYTMTGGGSNTDYTFSLLGGLLDEGTHNYYFYFQDGAYRSARLPAAGEWSFTVTDAGPELSPFDGWPDGVDPDAAPPDQTLTFKVHYHHPDGDSPIVQNVVIDGSAHPMSGSGNDTDYTLIISAGDFVMGAHEYYFYFEDPDGDGVTFPDDAPWTFTVTNAAPVLSLCSGWADGADPDVAYLNGLFQFCVHYEDTEGSAPATATVVIAGTPRNLIGGGSGTDYTLVTAANTFDPGVHAYYFQFEDPHGGSARLPETGEWQITVNTQPGDFDRDRDVDIVDYASLAPCFTGPCAVPPCDPPLYGDPACVVGDFDSDGDVDLYDFASFQLVFAGEAPPPPGAIAYWSFNEGTGNTVRDDSAYGNDGTLYGGTWVAGACGMALELTDTDIVRFIPSTWDAPISTQFTIATWVYWYGPGSDDSIIFDGRDDSWDQAGFALYVKASSHLLEFHMSQSDSVLTSLSAVPANTWTHVAVTFDDAGDVLRVYLNGQEDTSLSTSAVYHDSNHQPAIGNNHWAPGDGQWRPLNGVVDELRIYNRTLSAGEVSALHAQCQPGGPWVCRSPVTLSNSSSPGEDAPSQSFEVWNCGTDTLSYTITDDADWLSCAPADGASTGEHDTIICYYATAALSAGTYTATITITGNAGNSPQTIPVTLYIQAANLVAHWCFNDCIPEDCSGHGLNGTNSGAACLAGPGTCGSAFEFTGADKVHSIPSSWDASISVGFTLSAWVYWYGPIGGQDALIFDGRDDSWDQAGFVLGVKASSQVVEFHMNQSGSLVDSVSTLPTGTWTHVAVTFDDAANLLRVYLNGQQDTSLVTSAGYRDSAHNAAIGNNHWAEPAVFNGIIDEVRIYDGALDAGEVAALYEECQPQGPWICYAPASLTNTCSPGENAPSQTFDVSNCGLGTLSYSITDDATWLSCDPPSGTSTGEHDTITCTYTTAALSAGTYTATITIMGNAGNSPQTIPVTLHVEEPKLVAHWCFDDCTANDCSGHALNGANSGAACVPGPGSCGTALEFTGTDKVHTIPSSWDASLSIGFTISAWVFWYGPIGGQDALIFDGRDDSWDQAGFVLGVKASSQVVEFHMNQSGSLVDSVSTLPTGTWTHVAVTFDDAANLLRVYLNGQQDTSLVTSAGYRDSAHNAAIGNNHWAEPAVFNGIIDEVRIYDGALDASEIVALYEECQPQGAWICRTPVTLSNSCAVGQDAPNQSFEVWNCGEGTITYTIADDANWLSCAPASGTSAGEHDTITCTYTTAALSAGTYTATITITDPQAGNNPQAIPVTLYVQEPNLVAYWPFDEGTGSTANDVSGYGRHGSNSGGAWVAGIRGYALEFMDTTDRVNIPSAFDDPVSTGLTFVCWVKWSGSGTDSYVFDARKANTGGFIMYVSPSGTITFFLRKSDTSTQLISSTVPLPTGTWKCIAVTFDDGADLLRMFIDGVEDGSVAATAPYYNTNESAAVGNNHWNDAWGPFKGSIDEVRVYNRALSVSEVADLYALYLPAPSICRAPSALSNSCEQGTDAPSQTFEVWNCGDGTLSYIITDDADWLSCVPATGTSTGEHDTITCTYTTSGLPCGQHTATITLRDPQADNDPQTIAVTLSVTGQPSIDRAPASLNNVCAVGQDAPSQTFEVWNSGLCTLAYTITDDADWLTCAPATGTSIGEHDTITCTYTTAALSVGTYPATITITDPAAGNSPQTISVSLTVVDLNAGLQARWCFNDCTPNDCSGHGLNGTNSGAACVAGPGTCGSAFEFMDTTDRVDIPSTFDDSVNTGLTFVCWVKWSGSGTDSYVFDARKANTGGFIMYVDSSGTITFFLRKSDTGTQLISSTVPLPTGTWKCIAVTFDDGADLLRMFIDGVEDSSVSATAPYYKTNEGAAIGNNHWSDAWRPFKGVIDEVRVYNRALSANEVLCLYQQCSQ